MKDITTTFTPSGKVILLILIQLGGLGVLTFSSAILLLISKKIGFYTKKVVAEGLNHDAKFDIYSHIKKVVLVVISIEAIGAFFLFLHFYREYKFVTAFFMLSFIQYLLFVTQVFLYFPIV